MSEQVQADFARMLSSSPTLITPGLQVPYAVGNLPPVKAIRWLDEALRNGDNPGYRVSAELALMYGYSRAYDDMLANIRQAVNNNPSLYSFFHFALRLMMLIYACNDRVSIEEVMGAINKKLPQKDEILQDLKDSLGPKSNPYALENLYADWYAVELSMGITSGMPVRVRIFYPGKDESTYAYIFRRGQAPVAVPSPDNPPAMTLKPVEELLNQITGPTDGMVFITRT